MPLRRLSGAFNAWVNGTASFDPNCCHLTSERTLVRGRRDWGWPFSIMRRDPFFMSP